MTSVRARAGESDEFQDKGEARKAVHADSCHGLVEERS
jgi:hypothetical protein